MSAFIALLFLGGFFVFTFDFVFGFRTVLLVSVSVIIAGLTSVLVLRPVRGLLSWRRSFGISAFELFVFLFIWEMILVALFPLHSVLPEQVLARMNLVQEAEGPTCQVDIRIERTKEFYKNSNLDFEKVRFVYGGLHQTTAFFQNKGIKIDFLAPRSGITIGNTIYFVDPSYYCVPTSVVVHELVHVWQYQNGANQGLAHVPEALQWQYYQFADPQRLYDYGGSEGLRKARQEGKTFFDFGIEQQAEMVANYYHAVVQEYRYVPIIGGEEFTSEYIYQLEFFTRPVLNPQ